MNPTVTAKTGVKEQLANKVRTLEA